MGGTASLELFDEKAGVQPHDSAGGLDDLVVPAGLTAPAIVPGYFGTARRFATGSALEGAELGAGALALRRSMAIEAIVDPTLAIAAGGTHTIVARGRRGSSAERRLFSLAIDVVGSATWLRMGWDLGASAASVPGVPFALPTPGWVSLAAVRRWLSPTEVWVDYYANGQIIGMVMTSAGAIIDGDGGHVTYGCEGDGAGGYTNYFLGDVDQVRISNVERSAEEIEHHHRRLFTYGQWGYRALKALLPTGVYSQEPDSVIQREVMIEGDAIGLAWASIDELVSDFLPDRATGTLPRWEQVLRLEPAPTASIAQRRQSLVAFLRKVHGYNRDQIVKSLATALDCAEDQVQIIENDNTGPNPELVWLWFVYRDPSIPGHPNLALAQRIVDEIKPAHTRGIVGQATVMRYDDPNSLYDRDLLGE